jgi:non-specific protein-tyrosine kinase
MAELVQQMLADCDLLVLDTAPLLPVADTLALAPLVDSVLFVADASKTSGYAITQARQVLGQLRVPISGAVLNNYDPSKARGTLAGRYGYGYGYGYGRSAPPLEPSVDGGRPVPQPAVPPTGAAPANGGERVTPQVPPRP